MTTEEKLAALEAKIAALEKKLEENTESPAPKETSDVSVSTDDKPNDDKLQARARIVINRINSDGVREDSPPNEPLEKKSSGKKEGYAFKLRKIITDDLSDVNSSEIEIESSTLWELMKKSLDSYPYHIFHGDLPKTLYSPYEAIVLKWDNLVKATEDPNAGDKQARSDLKELLSVIETGSGDPKLETYFRKRTSIKEQHFITYEALWTLFPPGCLIYSKVFQGQDQVLIVEDNTSPWPYRDNHFQLLCWTYDWDGSQFKRLPLRLDFEPYDNEKPINSLPYFPLEYHEDPEALKTRLIERGMKYRKLCTAKPGSQMFEYAGQTVFLKKGFSGVQGNEESDDDLISQDVYGISSKPYPGGHVTKSVQVTGRVMVDFQSYFRYGLGVASVGDLVPNEGHTECQCPNCLHNPALRTIFRSNFDGANCDGKQWVPEQYLICPPRVLGYILREKQWAQLQVDLLIDVAPKDRNDTWSSGLKLASKSTKQMILDLVTGHGQRGLEVNDIVERKGKGLVILLYGPPGVGKTSTAETVAIKARKPLFAISVADVGTTAKHVEANLARIFALATTWQAILLIDEADVFLQSRSLGVGFGNNTERNALVSVFLRVLEYYQGILMLTTNQIAQFDVAVHSRIHVAIRYRELDETRAIAIFRNFLDPLNGQGKIRDMEDIMEWLEGDIHRMNFDGRQIRNVVTSACSLAQAQGSSQLEKSHLIKMADNVKDYKLEFIKQYEQYKSQQKGSLFS